VLEGADAGKASSWCCASAAAVQPDSTADANVESTEMQPIKAACDEPEDAKRIVEVTSDAAGLYADGNELANDGTPTLEGADAGKAFGWCCASASAVRPDANVESTEIQLVEAACDQPEDAKRTVQVAADAAGETQADAKELAANGAPVLEGADAWRAFGWCCQVESASRG